MGLKAQATASVSGAAGDSSQGLLGVREGLAQLNCSPSPRQALNRLPGGRMISLGSVVLKRLNVVTLLLWLPQTIQIIFVATS